MNRVKCKVKAAIDLTRHNAAVGFAFGFNRLV